MGQNYVARTAFVTALKRPTWKKISGRLFGREQCEVCALGVGARVAQGLGYGLNLTINTSDKYGDSNHDFYALIRETYGLDGRDTNVMFALNDTLDWSLNHIADELDHRFVYGDWSDEVMAYLALDYRGI